MGTVLRKLQREVFVLSLVKPISKAPTLDGFDTMLLEDGELEVGKGPDVTLNDLFGQLNAQGIEVVSLRNKANRLEELFIGLIENKDDGFKEMAGQ